MAQSVRVRMLTEQERQKLQQVVRRGSQTRDLHAYLRRRDNNARHPDILATQRRERARIRSEKAIRWGGRAVPAAT
jgi:hypothetical protein